MSQETTNTAKRLIEHTFGTLLLVWQRVARIALIAGVSGVLGTEVVAIIMTHHLPGGPTHLAAAALGIALAYAAGATVLVGEIFLGLLGAIRVIEGEVGAGAAAAAALVGHEARAARGELGLLFGRGVLPASRPAS
ncbi:MAG: hypothetical protein IVW57_19735, partial [Ktedonobacterales bacterium]|nr:hypothetical protein [Ktedonobacterales bacterium]